MSKNDDYANKRKIEGYQHLVRALKAEKQAIEEFGAFSVEAREADVETARARRNFELWRKK